MATNYVIVGGGLAAASAVEGIREVDREGSITLIAAERELPYHRPPLSKGFLAGNAAVESVRVREASWYRDNRVRVRLGQVAKSVHIGRQSLTLESGERTDYDRLLIATGSSPRRLAVPGADGARLTYLRTLQDAYSLRSAITPGSRVVAVGGGFIGMEVAATARHLGARVSVLEASPALYGGFADAQLSAFFQKVLESQGVTVRTSTRVARIRSQQSAVTVLTDDDEEFEADVVVAGVGAEPNTGWLAASGFEIDRGGLVANVRLETPAENVWAAGDVARFPDPVSRQPRRLEHWDNAMAQGKRAGRNMAGAEEPYVHQSAFFSDLFDITVNVLGATEGADSVEIRGTMDDAAPNFTALYLKGYKLKGAAMVNLNTADRSEEFNSLQKHIADGTVPEA